jgi:hypothetical protein
VRGVLISITLAALLAGCGSGEKKDGGQKGPPPKPACACRGGEDDCVCPHCGMAESGMEPADCPCEGRGGK